MLVLLGPKLPQHDFSDVDVSQWLLDKHTFL